jgi:hypothetical protein
MTSRHFISGVILLATGTSAAIAQGCRQEWTVSALSRVVAQASSDDQVYRACAINGHALRPSLRNIARPRSAVTSPAGAAQVCLAKLGDDTALAQLRDELEGRVNEAAIVKLARARTMRSVTLLVDYALRHQGDSSRIIDMGDVGDANPNVLLASMGIRLGDPVVIARASALFKAKTDELEALYAADAAHRATPPGAGGGLKN